MLLLVVVEALEGVYFASLKIIRQKSRARKAALCARELYALYLMQF